MPLQATSGAASYDAFGGGVPVVPNYIEDVFSTYLYAGTGATQTITNGIDESGKGAMTWIKCRSDATSHALYDTERGAGRILTTNTTGAQTTSGSGRGLSSFNSTGFSLDDDSFSGRTNQSGSTYASWTFREQPKFFDVVTYTGTGVARTVAHSLGSVPGCMIVKKTSATADWQVYHQSTAAGMGPNKYMVLNSTAAEATGSDRWNNTAPTSTVFTVGNAPETNDSGATYVAYLFAHDAGGFGLTGTDNVISCGSWSTTLVGGRYDAIIDLGWEPQWILFKPSNNTGNWQIYDNMRGWTSNVAGSNVSQRLYPSLANAEDTDTNTQLQYDGIGKVRIAVGASGYSGIYIAIRRGPMRVPTSGTSVFQPTAFTSQSGADTVSSGSVSVVDWGFVKKRASSEVWIAGDRLRGGSYLSFDATSAEASNVFKWDKQNAFVTNVDDTPSSFIGYSFRRAPSFFDEVCYTGVGGTATFNHNLTVIPELLIIKRRSGVSSWPTLYNFVGSTFDKLQGLNQDGGAATNTYTDGAGLGGAPTATTFTVDSTSTFNGAGSTFVAYLFATCAGVSKCFNYTGNGSSQTINCGFTGGARWILIKRTDSTGDWYVWDSARGIVSGNDPHLSLNSTAAEVTTDDTIDTDSTGFVVNQVSATNVNVSSATYIGLAIA